MTSLQFITYECYGFIKNAFTGYVELCCLKVSLIFLAFNYLVYKSNCIK